MNTPDANDISYLLSLKSSGIGHTIYDQANITSTHNVDQTILHWLDLTQTRLTKTSSCSEKSSSISPLY